MQFPFYGGIMGIMQTSGLAEVIITGIVGIATAKTLPVFSYLSAAAVNLFIPSQGGQWIVQGPLLIDAANQLGAAKSGAKAAARKCPAADNCIQSRLEVIG